MKFGLDTETNKHWQKKGSLRCVQIYNPEKHWTTVFYRGSEKKEFQKYRVMHTAGDVCAEPCISPQLTPSSEETVAQLLRDKDFVYHNSLFDCYILQRDLKVFPKIAGDSFILANLLPQNPNVSRSLDNQMKMRVDKNYDKYKWGRWEDYDWDQPTPCEKMLKYAATDAMAGYLLEEAIKVQFPKYANLIYTVEQKLVKVLVEARLTGLRVEEESFKAALKKTGEELTAQLTELCQIRGGDVKVASPKGLAKWLFEERGNTPVLKTATGAPSTSEDALLYLTDPIVDKILVAKESQATYSGLKSLDAPENAHLFEIEKETTGNGERSVRVFHPEFKPLSDSQGGRIYTTNPSANSWNWKMRDCVVPKLGHYFYLCDVSAFELMVLAYAAGEQDLVAAYLSGLDIHRGIASEIFDVTGEAVTDEQREAAKTVEFAVIFGSEGHSVARKLRIPLNEAMGLVMQLKGKYKKIAELEQKIHNRVEKTGVAITAFGRYRKIPDGYAGHMDKAKRKAMNFFAQSGAADIAKMAMVTMNESLPSGAQVIFTVFDSFLIEVENEIPKGVIDEKVARALTIPTERGEWKFLFKSGIGNTWKQAKEAMKAVSV